MTNSDSPGIKVFGTDAAAWAGKSVAVTGGCGTIGRALVDALLDMTSVDVVAIDNSEFELFRAAERTRGNQRATWKFCDVRDAQRLTEVVGGVDVLIHTAALKHVWLCEDSPHDAMQTNVVGTENVIAAARASGVGRVLFVSSDKAVSPTSVLGASKLLGERLMTAANADGAGDGPVFASVRFGNVLGSRGSVFDVFREQIAAGGPLTLTDRRMSRFMISLAQAVRLVLGATWAAKGGEVLVARMPAIDIVDLAHVMLEELAPRFGYAPSAIGIEEVGARAGEKIYEELLNDDESQRAYDAGSHIVVPPAVSANGGDLRIVGTPYRSDTEPKMSRDALTRFLLESGLCDSIQPVLPAALPSPTRQVAAPPRD